MNERVNEVEATFSPLFVVMEAAVEYGGGEKRKMVERG